MVLIVTPTTGTGGAMRRCAMTSGDLLFGRRATVLIAHSNGRRGGRPPHQVRPQAPTRLRREVSEAGRDTPAAADRATSSCGQGSGPSVGAAELPLRSLVVRDGRSEHQCEPGRRRVRPHAALTSQSAARALQFN